MGLVVLTAVFFPQRMKRRSCVCSTWKSRATLMWTPQSTSTMFLKQRSSTWSPVPHPYHQLCHLPLSPLQSSRYLWSPPTLQAHLLYLLPRSPLLLLLHWPPQRQTLVPLWSKVQQLCSGLHSPNLTPKPWWLPTSSSRYKTTTFSRSSSPKPTTLNYTSSWFSAIRVPSFRPYSSKPYCPIQAPCFSRPPCTMAPSAGEVLLMTVAT